MNQDKKTEKIEMLQSHEALLQKRREQARARRNNETSEQRRIRLQRNRQRAAESRRRGQLQGPQFAATEKKRRLDREHRKQKRAEETTPERKQRLQAVKEYARFKSRIAGQSPTELQHSFYPSKNSKVMKNKNTRSPFTDRIHFLVRLCSWARQSAKIPCLV